MKPPDSERIIQQFKTLAESLMIWDGVGDRENPASYSPSKALVFDHIPLKLVVGESPDVLRSPLDVLELKGGETDYRINAFCFDEKHFSQTPAVHDNLRGELIPQGERILTYTYRHWYFYQFEGNSKLMARRHVEAWRQKLIALPKLGFTTPEVNFIDGHGELQTLDEDLQPFDESFAHIIDMELTVRVTEPQ